MTVMEARRRIVERWHEIVEKGVCHSVRIDDALTTEYPWGWVFYFVGADAQSRPMEEAYARDRLTGQSYPVGIKGLEHSLNILMSWRDQLGVSEVDQ
jgi:hypothetical protein